MLIALYLFIGLALFVSSYIVQDGCLDFKFFIINCFLYCLLWPMAILYVILTDYIKNKQVK